MRRILLEFLLLVVGTFCQAALLAPDGREYKAIEIAPDAPASVRFAAQEMHEFVARTTGSELPVVVGASTELPVIRLGSRSKIDTGEFPVDGFRVETVPDALLIAGRDAVEPTFAYRNPWQPEEMLNRQLGFSVLQEQGTRCGVLRFLERFCHVRFYLPGELGIVADALGDVRLPELKWDKAPRFPYRYCWYANAAVGYDSAVWAQRAGFGGKAPVVIMHSYSRMNKYQKTHPEFFALVDGKRSFGTECVAAPPGHLCLNAPGLVEAVVDEAQAYFKEFPEQDIYPLVPGDGLTRICECPACQKDLRPDVPENGRFSYHIWNFTNKVARELAKRCPGKRIGMLAYENYRMPPEGFKPEPNIAIMFAYSRPHMGNKAQATELHEQMEAWSRLAQGPFYYWVWYLTHWSPWNNLPIFYPSVIQEEIRRMAANPKHQGEFIEAENFSYEDDMSKMATPGLEHLNLYLTGKLYWDPELNVDDLLSEYYRRFYGPTEAPMRKFWTRAAEIWSRKIQETTDLSPDRVFPSAVLEELYGYLQEAVGLAKDQGIFADRVKLIADEFQVAYDRGANPRQRNAPVGTLTQVKTPDEIFETPPMRLFNRDGALMPPNTYVYMGYDRRNLYFRFLCFEPHMDQLRNKATQPDDPALAQDDSIEILLVPNADKQLFPGYCLVVNCTGILLDQKVGKDGEVDRTWQSGAQVSVRKEANRWIVDIAIPLSRIGIVDPNFSGEIGVNFYRNQDGDKGLPALMWSPTGEEVHWVPKKFGRLQWRSAAR